MEVKIGIAIIAVVSAVFMVVMTEIDTRAKREQALKDHRAKMAREEMRIRNEVAFHLNRTSVWHD